jgi:hypothetical protein
VSEANVASPETSAAEDKSANEQAADNKDGVEMTVYKLTEKDTVAFAKTAVNINPVLRISNIYGSVTAMKQ